jgi:hypothetical protein
LSNAGAIIATLQESLKKSLITGLTYQALIARLVSQITQPTRATGMINTSALTLVAASHAWFALAKVNYPFKIRLSPVRRKQDHEL